jgi:hypothetical protein
MDAMIFPAGQHAIHAPCDTQSTTECLRYQSPNPNKMLALSRFCAPIFWKSPEFSFHCRNLPLTRFFRFAQEKQEHPYMARGLVLLHLHVFASRGAKTTPVTKS